eukprot:s3342_g5.t2
MARQRTSQRNKAAFVVLFSDTIFILSTEDSGDDYEIQCGISDANRNEIDHLASCSRLRILFTIVGLLPVYGISPGIFLLIFLIVDKTDEFQLVSFILEFKDWLVMFRFGESGFQYLTQGLVRSLMGYFLYLNCVTAPGQEEDFCATNGPGSVAPTLIVLVQDSGPPSLCLLVREAMALNRLLQVGYLLQVVLVWNLSALGRCRGLVQQTKPGHQLHMLRTAFVLLPFSSRKGRSTLTGHLDEPLPHRSKQRGGYIIYLLWYDLLTFVVCAGALVYVLQLREWLLDDWMVKHAFFAIQMVHGYLSMPFFFFTIPLIRNVLSHTAPTGYDRSGCCRQFLGPARPPKPPADAGNIPRVLEKAEAAKVLENLRRLLAGLRVRALDLEDRRWAASSLRGSASERLVHELKVFPNHNTYNGTWLNGRCHGDGLYTWSDGTEYAGEFREGLMWGQGEKRWSNGRRYCGEWVQDMMWGNGEMQELDDEQACMELPFMILKLSFNSETEGSRECSARHKTLVDVHSFGDFWSWLRLGLVPLVLPRGWVYSERRVPDVTSVFGLSDADSMQAPNAWDFENRYRAPVTGDYLHYNRIIGGLRFRQQVAPDGPCRFPGSASQELFDRWYAKPCMPAYEDTSGWTFPFPFPSYHFPSSTSADQGGDSGRRRDRGQGGGYGGGYDGNRHRDDARRRGGGGQFPQAAHNPYDVRLPHFLESIAECEDDKRKTSIIMVDTRDERIVSPFQAWLAWLVREIMTNSSSSVNVLTERDQTGSPCGGWDDKTARALSHVAFQPFTWPVLRDTSPSYTDVKVYNGNEILFHWIFRGYRADTDLSVQQQFADEFFIRGVRQSRARLSVVVAAFSGWRVSVFSFELEGLGVLVRATALALALSRVTDRSSDDAVGNDADRVEFRYRDANNRIDLKCARTSVPATWLTVSHISGPTLIQTISRCRDQQARVEGPEQTEQFARLAAAHKGWWHDAATLDPAKVGVLVTFVAGLDAGNFHVQAESKLFVREPEIVATRALAEMSHDEAAVAAVPRGPPALAHSAWSAAADSANALANVPASSGKVAVRRRAQDELQTRTFASAVDPINYDQSNEEDTRGHISDPVRDQARDDRSFSRSTAKLTPQLFAELTGPGWTFGGGGRSAASASTVTVREVMEAEPAPDDPQNLLGPIDEPTFRPHRTP